MQTRQDRGAANDAATQTRQDRCGAHLHFVEDICPEDHTAVGKAPFEFATIHGFALALIYEFCDWRHLILQLISCCDWRHLRSAQLCGSLTAEGMTNLLIGICLDDQLFRF